MQYIFSEKADQDPVDAAILDLVKSRQETSLRPEFTTEEHFYLSVAQVVSGFDFVTRMRLRQAVLDTVMKVLAKAREDLDRTD